MRFVHTFFQMDNYSYTDYNFDFSDKLTYSEGQLTPTIEENQYLPSYSPPLPFLPYGSPPLNNNNVHIYGNIMPLQVTSDKNSSMKRRRTPRDHDDLPLLSPSSTSSFSTTATTSTAEQRTERCSAPTKVSKTTGTSNVSSRRATREVDKKAQVEDNDDDEEKLRMKNLERNRLAGKINKELILHLLVK